MKTSAIVVLFLLATTARAVPPDAKMLEALRPLHAMVGQWAGKGVSQTSTGWDEKLEVMWGFRERDGRVSLNFYFDASDALKVGLLTYDPETKAFRFVAVLKDGGKLTFEGEPSGSQSFRLARVDGSGKLELMDLGLAKGASKLLYELGEKLGTSRMKKAVWVELFRQGKDPGEYQTNPKCVVTGAPGRVTVQVGGKSLFVADANCAAEVKEHPERYTQ